MVIDKNIEILITVRNITKYKELGYICNLDENLNIDIKHLSTYSRNKINAKCYCGNIKLIEYRLYSTNILNGGFFSCSKKCSRIKTEKTNLERYGFISPIECDNIKYKIKDTNLERYGVNNPFESNIIKDKIKKTFLEKYGVDSYTKTIECKEKIKETNLERYGTQQFFNSDVFKEKCVDSVYIKYGVDHISKSDVVKDKIKETNLERYGFEYGLQNEFIKDKCKDTSLFRYGVEYYTKTDEFKEKVKKTCQERYGVESYTKTDEFKEKVKNNNIDKYGVVHHTMSIKYHSNTKIGRDLKYVKYLENKISLFNCDKGHFFEIKSNNYYDRTNNKTTLCTICNPIGESKSIKEEELLEYIKSIYDGKIISSYRDGLEIDIYLPELNIGFEFNGLYWHSEKFKEKNYHLNKTNHFKEKGIRIIHIWEDDWTLRKDIVKSQIKNLLKINSKKIFARKCFVKEIKDSKMVSKFLNDSHIQGSVSSQIKIGLYFENELVSLMTFNTSEGRKKMEDGGWNLNRFCNKCGVNVLGGASKLLSYFIKNYDVKRIVSYADKDWSVGNLYEVLGFENVSDGKPDYKYIVDKKRVHKSRYRKSRLNTKLTESQEMRNREINKIYDCGKIKFEKFIL